MTSATEVLRRLLDERGVEWTVPDESWNQDSITYWKVGSIKWAAFESENDTLWLNCNSVTDLTPAQVIAVTLGSCNCSNDCTNGERTGACYDTGESRIFHCSECGLGLDDVFIDDEEYYPFADFPRFCPFCGAKVVEPTTNNVDAEVDS